MIKQLLTASTCSLLLFASACGSGGGGGGGEAPPPPSPAAEVVDCLKKEKVRARAGKSGARLVRAPNARDAVVVRFRGNTANVLFFASKEIAATVKEQVKNEDLANIEEDILIVFEKTPRGDQNEQVKDCLPEDQSQQEEDQQK